MDAVALLRALAALALYPGGVFLVFCAGLARAVQDLRARDQAWSVADVAAGGALLLATSQLPAPGSPVLLLPPEGAPASLLAAAVCVAAALGFAGALHASRRDATLAAAALLPVGALAGVTASLGFAAVVVASDSGLVLAARLVAALCALLAVGALLVRARIPAFLRGVFTATVAALAVLLAVPQAVLGADGWKVAVLVVAAVAAYAVALRVAASARRGGGVIVVSCAAASVCSTVLLLVAAVR